MQGIMNVAFGHSNMDMDCLGSLILVKALFPDYQLVKSNFIHPTAQKVYNIYRDYFDFKNPDDLDNIHIDDVIIVDTCVSSKVKEYFDHIKNKDEVNVRVIDHHNLEDCDIPEARTEGAPFGANVTYLGKLAMAQGIILTPETATIALTGLYADTGRLLYENVRREDFEVSGYLVEMGASLKMVKTFLESFIETQQLHVLNQLFVLINHPLDIQGHTILSTCLPLDNNVNGLNTVVDKVMEVENPDAYFAFFSIPKKNTVILIARSRKAKIDLHNILLPYGGGGHLGKMEWRIAGADGRTWSKEYRG
jgi:tRNA nucleotidyltransferase (CCA-adding enzyme)